MAMGKFIFATFYIIFCMETETFAQTYRAVVVDHVPTRGVNANNTILENIKYYRNVVEEERQSGSPPKIVVFPEYGLTTLVHDPTEYAIHIRDNINYPYTHEKALEELSDLAKEHDVYLVVNLLEKSNTTGNWLYYSTNLVFNTTGHIQARYRKINLNDDETRLTPGTEIVTFRTNFDVTFGIFTSADISFYKPSRQIFENHLNVTDIVYPNAWNSTIPFYAALSVQSGYALANGVNLLAASYSEPSRGLGGSGLYPASGTAEVYIDSNPQPGSKNIVKDLAVRQYRQNTSECSLIRPHGLPGADSKPNISNFITGRLFVPNLYKFQDIDLNASNKTYEVCQMQLCCTFEVTVAVPANNNEMYKAMVFDGLMNRNGKIIHEQICSLVACESASVDSCGKRRNGTNQFTAIHISAKADKTESLPSFFTPITLTNDLKPVQKVSFCSKSDNKQYASDLILGQSEANIIVFGIYGHVPTSSAFHNQATIVLLFVALATVFFNNSN